MGTSSSQKDSNQQGGRVARRTNYGFEKRQRELEKKKKKEAKREAKRLLKEAAAAGDVEGTDVDGAVETDADEETDSEIEPEES